MADIERFFDVKPFDLALCVVWLAGEIAFLIAAVRIVWAQLHVQTYADAVQASQHAPMTGNLWIIWHLSGIFWFLHMDRAKHKGASPNL